MYIFFVDLSFVPVQLSFSFGTWLHSLLLTATSAYLEKLYQENILCIYNLLKQQMATRATVLWSAVSLQNRIWRSGVVYPDPRHASKVMPKKGGCENRLGLPHGLLGREEERRRTWVPSPLRDSSGMGKVSVVLGWSYNSSCSQLPGNLSGGVVVHCRNGIVHHGLGYAEPQVEDWVCETIVNSALCSAIVSLLRVSNSQDFWKDIFLCGSPSSTCWRSFKTPQLLKCKNGRKIIC